MTATIDTNSDNKGGDNTGGDESGALLGDLGAAQICAAWAQADVADDYVVYERENRWVFAGGRKLPGLMRRRAAEAQLYQRFPPG